MLNLLWTLFLNIPQSDADKLCNSKEEFSRNCFEDKWGYKIDWSNLEDGWDEEKRQSQLYLEQQIEKQPIIVPSLSKTGYKKIKIPEQLYNFILNQRRLYDLCSESYQISAHQNSYRILNNGSREAKENSQLMRIREPDIFQNIVNAALGGILESWSGIPLQPSAIYGIRRYLRGARLMLHVDRLNTHVVSAVMQIDQKVDLAWPLLLIDLEGKKKAVVLAPGEMLLYESAKVPHGRQIPLEGDFYDNLLVHFRPAKEWYKMDEVVGENNKIFTKNDLI